MNLDSAYMELKRFGIVEFQTANELVDFMHFVEDSPTKILIKGKPGSWKVFDATQPMGEVI